MVLNNYIRFNIFLKKKKFTFTISKNTSSNIFFQNSLKSIDVTKESINILKAVQEICGTNNNFKNNFTFTHFVDIFKGNKTQKVILHGVIY